MDKNLFLNAYKLIQPAQRKTGLAIIFLLSISSILDFFSLAFFLPVIYLLIDPEGLQASRPFQNVYNFFGFTSVSSMSISFTVFVLFFIILKTRINNWITQRKAAFGFKIGSTMALRLVNRYLEIAYLQYVQRDLSKEVNLISGMPLVFANNIVIPAGTLISETLVFFLLLSGIAIFDINVFAFLFLIVVPAFFIHRLRQKKIKTIGTSLRAAYPLLLKHTLQIVEGLADIRAFGKESFFKKKFENASKSIGRIFSQDHTLHTGTPRITEIIAAGCVCTIIIYAILSRQSHSETLILLSIYAGASFRIIPSVNRILAAAHQMKVHEYSVEEFSRMLKVQHLQSANPEIESIRSFDHEIILRDVDFGYRAQGKILNKVNMVIRKGEKIALVGQSGAGKTTLLLILLRFLHEQNGEMHVDGKKMEENNWPAWRKLIGYVPQSPYILDGSVIENIAFGVPEELIDHGKMEILIRKMDLADWISTLPEGLQTRICEKGAKISGGQKQRLAIARALYHGAEILLLDEVTNQLDPKTENEVISTLLNVADRSKTIIMITHHPELLKKFDVVYELKEGNLKKSISHFSKQLLI